jgi:hypothetical protein
MEQYSAKLDDIHLYNSGDSKTVCGKPMLTHNYLVTSSIWTADDRKDLLKFHPRMICIKCLSKVKQ